MRLFPMRTFPVSANGESCLGPVFRPLTDSDQHSFRHSYVIHVSVFRHFLHKITNESVFEISIDIFSELIVSALKTDNVAQSKSNDVHINPGYEYDSGRVYTICMVI